MPGGKLGSEAFYRRLGAIAESTGSSSFYSRVAEFVAELLRCKRWLVMRYARYAAPEFLVNAAMTDEDVRSFLEGLYRLDPLLRLVRSGTRDGVVILSRIRDSTKSDSTYYDRLFHMFLIRDEAAVLLATPGSSSIAICVERATQPFSDRDRETLKTLHPMIRSLHLVHLDRLFARSSHDIAGRQPTRAPEAILILDKHNHPVYRNESWTALERQGQVPDLEPVYRSRDRGVYPLGADTILHWEPLGESFAVAPHGRICTIEARSPGYINVDFGEALADFQKKHQLTQRERDIVNLVLQGCANARIAEKLDLSKGTVRNYRYRLYYKLDITTERELFLLFMAHLLGKDQ